MKGNKAMTDAERQANRRKRIKADKGTRFSVVLSPEASEALESICKHMDKTKKRAIESALILYWDLIEEERI